MTGTPPERAAAEQAAGQDGLSEAEARQLLFTLPPAEFVAARNSLAARLRRTGGREAAARIKALRKPTPAAWVANALFRQARPHFDAALRAGDALIAARRAGGLTAVQMQAAVAAQRSALAELMRLAAACAADGQVALGRPHLVRLRATLEALCAGSSRESLGELQTELPAPSFDGLAATAAPPHAPDRAATGHDGAIHPGAAKAPQPLAATAPAPGNRPPPANESGNRALARAQAHMRQRVRALEAIRDARSAERRQAQRQALRATDALQSARDEVAAARRRLETARTAHTKAEAELLALRSRSAELTAALKGAQDAVATARSALAGAPGADD